MTFPRFFSALCFTQFSYSLLILLLHAALLKREPLNSRWCQKKETFCFFLPPPKENWFFFPSVFAVGRLRNEENLQSNNPSCFLRPFSNSLISSLKPIFVLRDSQTSIYFATSLSRLSTLSCFYFLFFAFPWKKKGDFGNVKDKVWVCLWFNLIKWWLIARQIVSVNCERI